MKQVKREVTWLVVAVLLVDAVFVALYFLAGLRSTSDFGKIAFTALWTVVILAVVIRGLARVRSVRFHQTP
jgi:membrane protein YdbS with pleckstrin-like domain